MYRVLRKGRKLGEHVGTVTEDGGAIIARNDVELVARLFGIPVYRYEHSSEEVWHDGILQRVTSKTNKDGKKIELRGERRKGVLHVTGRNGEIDVEGRGLTSSLWHPCTPYASHLLDIEDGVLKSVQSKPKAEEKVPTPNGGMSARHFRLTGDMERDLWYDAGCHLLRVEFNTKKDGSRITLEPITIDV